LLIFFIINLVFSQMSSNFGSSYFASSRGARSYLSSSQAVLINPANIVVGDTSSFSINSYCYDKYCSFGSAFSDINGFGLYFSLDDIDKDISFDSYSVFGALSFKISEHFSVGASLGYFHSNIAGSGLKYSSSISFSPFNLDKKHDKWLVSAGYLSGFLENKTNEYFFSYSYIDKLFSISLDFLITEDKNYEVLAASFKLTDSLKLISSLKFLEFKTEALRYAAGLKYYSSYAALAFSILKEEDRNYYALSLSFYGE